MRRVLQGRRDRGDLELPTQDEIVVRERTVADAIRKALSRLQAQEDEVTVVVEERPRFGLFGLGRKDAKVRVSRKIGGGTDGGGEVSVSNGYRRDRGAAKAPREPMSSAAADFAADGTLQVRDGRVIVTPPQGPGAYPSVRPGKQVRIWVGASLVEHSQVVTETDDIRIVAEDIPAETFVWVQVSEDGLEATLNVRLRPGRRYRLMDQFGSGELTIHATPAEAIPPELPTVSELKQALAKEGIVFGIREEAFEEILSSPPTDAPTTRSALAAVGVPPRPTEHERIELLFDPSPRVRVEAEDEQVDLLSLYQLTTVRPGGVLAVLHPGTPGKPGRSVAGEEIPVQEVRRARLTAGEGTRWSGDNRRLYAERGGRPVLWGTTATVHAKHVVSGNVDAKSGHVKFDGDVEISGKVEGSVNVRAAGSVTIGGSVSEASVQADESVLIVGGIAKSKVTAGLRGSRLLDRLALLQPMTKQFHQFLQSVEQAASRRTGIDMEDHATGALAKAILETRYPDIIRNVQALRAFGESGISRTDRQFALLIRLLDSQLLGLGALSLQNTEPLRRLYKEMQQLVEMFEAEYERSDGHDLVTKHVHNADARATGRIVLRGGGCVYSRLWAGRGVQMLTGVFRGDEMTVHEGNVTLREAGSRRGGSVAIRIVTDGIFQAQRVHPGVHLTIADRQYEFTSEKRHVTARLQDGELQVRHR